MRGAQSDLAHLLVFIATFSLEVTVRAQEFITQEPLKCLARATSVCAIENSSSIGFEVKMGSSTLILDQGAAIIRQADDELRLIKGTIWIKAASTIRIRSEFGEIANSEPGDFWISRTSEVMTGSAISTPLQLSPRASKDTLEVAPGLQNTIGAIGFDGQATTSIPLPIPFKDHILRWARLYHGPKKQFESEVAEFHDRWLKASETAADISQTLYERQVASVENAKAARAAQVKKANAENNELRSLFRKRSLEGL